MLQEVSTQTRYRFQPAITPLLYRIAARRARLPGYVIFLAAFRVFGTPFFPLPTSDHAMAITVLVSYVVLAIIAL